MNKEKPRHGNGRPHQVFHAKKPTFGFGQHPRWPEGYRLVAKDGGVFNFGDAAFAGSMHDLRLRTS